MSKNSNRNERIDRRIGRIEKRISLAVELSTLRPNPELAFVKNSGIIQRWKDKIKLLEKLKGEENSEANKQQTDIQQVVTQQENTPSSAVNEPLKNGSEKFGLE